MRQVMQALSNGKTAVADVPVGKAVPSSLLIRSASSLVSIGTERMLVEFGQANLLAKARAQPDKVKQVLDKIRTDGLIPTLEAVFSRLGEPLPLGYCNAGTVVEVDRGVEGFAVGDRVASNGNHAEFVCVPKNLCAKIPDGVTDEAASFTVLASIGLQGIRLLQPTLGERVVVFGAGLIGLVSVQLLRASGCHVLAVDLDPARLRLAESFGATSCLPTAADVVAAAKAFSAGVGVDGVIITASTKSDELVHQAAEMCRKRGRIILVGVVGLNLRRSDFYEKELTFQVSCSYGPGRYDPKYEQEGHDYPPGFVRWTEQRNFEAVLGAMAQGTLDVAPLITHRFPIDRAPDAYKLITSDPAALGVILQYPCDAPPVRTVTLRSPAAVGGSRCVAALIGAGNFSKMTLAPALAKTGARLKVVVGQSNSAAVTHVARTFGFEQASTDLDAVASDPEINTVFISTNHNSHAAMVERFLASGRHVFVEKPLCLSLDELRGVVRATHRAATARRPPALMVGFNRRFSPFVQRMKELLSGRTAPLAMQMTVNAGFIPPDHWVHDPVKGGGRIVGEGCHFIDLMVFLSGSRVNRVSALCARQHQARIADMMTINLEFADGSIGSLNYLANGHKGFPKECLEVFSEGRVLRLNNYRELTGVGFSNFARQRTWHQDKGHARQFAEFVTLVEKGGPPLISLADLVNVTLATFAAELSSREGRMVVIDRDFDLEEHPETRVSEQP